jgi:hypothetical protein
MILGLRQDHRRFHGCHVLWYASPWNGSVALGVLMNANRLWLFLMLGDINMQSLFHQLELVLKSPWLCKITRPVIDKKKKVLKSFPAWIVLRRDFHPNSIFTSHPAQMGWTKRTLLSCSVGIFIDQGLILNICNQFSNHRDQLNFAMLLTRGHDEA